jgi:hypothetical protein
MTLLGAGELGRAWGEDVIGRRDDGSTYVSMH